MGSCDELQKSIDSMQKKIKESEDKVEQRRRDPKRRYAFDWYVKDMDKFYSEMAERRLSGEVKKINHKIKTALAVTSAVFIGCVVIFSLVLHLLHKSR